VPTVDEGGKSHPLAGPQGARSAVPRQRDVPSLWFEVGSPPDIVRTVQVSPPIHLLMCILGCMRTNIEIDDRVLQEAQELIGARTKREAVDVALRELVASHRRIGVLDLRGRVRWEGDLDESRRGRS
jgi:Arc/MetJ family transcription regulator